MTKHITFKDFWNDKPFKLTESLFKLLSGLTNYSPAGKLWLADLTVVYKEHVCHHAFPDQYSKKWYTNPNQLFEFESPIIEKILKQDYKKDDFEVSLSFEKSFRNVESIVISINQSRDFIQLEEFAAFHQKFLEVSDYYKELKDTCLRDLECHNEYNELVQKHCMKTEL